MPDAFGFTEALGVILHMVIPLGVLRGVWNIDSLCPWLSEDHLVAIDNRNLVYGVIHHSRFFPRFGLCYVQFSDDDTDDSREEAWFVFKYNRWWFGGSNEYRRDCHAMGSSPVARECDCAFCTTRRIYTIDRMRDLDIGRRWREYARRRKMQKELTSVLSLSRALREAGSAILPIGEDGEPSHFREPDIVKMIVSMALY